MIEAYTVVKWAVRVLLIAVAALLLFAGVYYLAGSTTFLGHLYGAFRILCGVSVIFVDYRWTKYIENKIYALRLERSFGVMMETYNKED